MPNAQYSHLSPSLARVNEGDAPAYELKFVISAMLAHEIERWADHRMQPDMHGDARWGGGYLTTSVYTDTVELDVFHRSPTYRRRKYRVRRYGENTEVFLECKNKSGDRVRKRRVHVPDSDLTRLADAESPLSWPGSWFHSYLQRKGLGPAVAIRYVRQAYIDECAGGAARLTLDRDLRGSAHAAWIPPADCSHPILPTDQVILECKFTNALPQMFKELLAEFRLNPAAVSKYRLCREALGTPPATSKCSISIEAQRA